MNETGFCRSILRGVSVLEKAVQTQFKSINETINDIVRHPFEDIGNPGPLRNKYAGFWSRRIGSEHLLMHQVRDQEILIAKCEFQYD